MKNYRSYLYGREKEKNTVRFEEPMIRRVALKYVRLSASIC